MIVIFTPGGAMVYHTNSLQVLFDRQRPVSISGWGAIESDGRLQFICSPLEKLGPLEHCQNTKNTKPKRPTKKSQSEKKILKKSTDNKKVFTDDQKRDTLDFLALINKTMDFGAVVHKIENTAFDTRFDNSGNNSECSNRTPSIESWENASGKISIQP